MIHKKILELINRTSLTPQESKSKNIILAYSTKNSNRDHLIISKSDTEKDINDKFYSENDELLYYFYVKDNNKMTYNQYPIDYPSDFIFNKSIDNNQVILLFTSKINDDDVTLKAHYNLNNSKINIKLGDSLNYAFSQVYDSFRNNNINDLLDIIDTNCIEEKETERQPEPIIREIVKSVIDKEINIPNEFYGDTLFLRIFLYEENTIDIFYLPHLKKNIIKETQVQEELINLIDTIKDKSNQLIKKEFPNMKDFIIKLDIQ